MKPQDLIFLSTLALLIIIKQPKLAVLAGIASLILAIPLFYFHIFFTAQRLTWYAFAFFVLAVIAYSFEEYKKSGGKN